MGFSRVLTSKRLPRAQRRDTWLRGLLVGDYRLSLIKEIKGSMARLSRAMAET